MERAELRARSGEGRVESGGGKRGREDEGRADDIDDSPSEISQRCSIILSWC